MSTEPRQFGEDHAQGEHVLLRSYTPAVLAVRGEDGSKEFRNPKFRRIAEVYRESLAALAHENLRLREELGLDLETPLDWESESDSEEEEMEVATSRPTRAMPRIPRSASCPAVPSKALPADSELRKSSSSGIARHQVLPMYLHSPLDHATTAQFKATLVQDLRRFSEFHEMGDLLTEDEHMTWYDIMVHILIQFRLPMSPNSEVPLVWDMLGLCFIAYDVFAIPLQAFPIEEEKVPFLYAMGWITLCFWTFDIVMSNIVGFFDGPELVMQQFRITKRYLKTWFLLDAIVVIPDWFTRLAQDDGSNVWASMGRIIRSARAVRVIRLLRLLKLQKMINKIYDCIDSEYLFIVMDILRLLLFIIVLNHVIACLWYQLGRIGLDNPAEFRFNWLQDTGYEEVILKTVVWQYTTALHWSLTQFTPAGMDVFARNVMERIMSVIVLGFAVIIFSSVLASVSASMTALRNLQGDTKKQFWLLRRYLRKKKVTIPSRVRIIKFLEHVTLLQAKTVKMVDVKLLNRLSSPLTELLNYEIHKDTVMNYPFLNYVGGILQSILVKLCASSVKQVQFAHQDCIFRAGDLGEHMYFLCSGHLKYAWPGSRYNEELREGDWLAEATLWTQWSHCGMCVVSSQPTVLTLLSPQGFANVMRLSQCSFFLCRRFAFSFVSMLNNAGSSVSDLPWDPNDVAELTRESAAACGLSNLQAPRVKRRSKRLSQIMWEAVAGSGPTSTVNAATTPKPAMPRVISSSEGDMK